MEDKMILRIALIIVICAQLEEGKRLSFDATFHLRKGKMKTTLLSDRVAPHIHP